MHYKQTKRFLDLVSGSFGIIVTLPIQIIVASAVAAKHGRPVLFKQERPGLNGEIFELLKFRTMLHPSPGRTTDEERLTDFGRFLRSTSLDELPSLWNVVRGDLSIVGPRPLLVKYLEFYSAEQARRHEVRPGITGLAQAMGRNGLSWTERFKLDVEYVDNQSFALDLRILLLTIRTVVKREGINEAGHSTMTEFQG